MMSEPDTDVLSDFSAAAGKFVPRARKLLSSAMISATMLQSPGLAPQASLKSDPADRVSFTEIVRSAVRGADALPLHIADIKAEIPEDEIFVRSPRTALSASVMSLIRNAAEAHATEIRLSLSSSDGMASVVVADNGDGMSDAVSRRCTEPFFTTKDTGTGLGLAIVSGTAKLSRGTLRLESREGAGSVFMLSLPLAHSM